MPRQDKEQAMTAVIPRRPLRNPQRFIGNILWSIVAVSGLLAVVFMQFDEPVSRLRVACAIIGGIMLIPALMCEFIMLPRVERRLRAFRKGQYLAHWIYTPEEWQRWRELCQSRWQTRLREPVGEAFIDRDGVYFDGGYESWTLAWNYWLEEVALQQGRPDWLEITYAWSSGQKRGYSTIRIPIPDTDRGMAEDVVQELQKVLPPAKS
jgi:hypothetical protein